MVAAAVGGAAVVGGIMQSGAASDAADAQAGAAKDAAAAQREAAAQAREDLMPYNQLGQGMINPLLRAMGYMPGRGAKMESREQIYQRLLPQYTSGGSAGSGSLSDSDMKRLAILKGQYARLNSSNGESNQNPFGRDLDALKRQIDQLEGNGGSAGRIDYNALNAAVDAEMQRQQTSAYDNLQIDPNNPLHQRFSFTGEDLENTPGYQFTLEQGLRAGNNSMTARGLGLSGAQLKGAEKFAAGLASTTFNDQFNNALSTFNTNYNSAANNANRLAGLVQMGQNSAAQTGNVGMTGAANSGNLLTQAANAQASGIMGSANAITGGLNSAANAYMTQQGMNSNPLLLSSMYGR